MSSQGTSQRHFYQIGEHFELSLSRNEIKGAKIARIYWERRDADPDKRRMYLQKERDKWKKDSPKKKESVSELSGEGLERIKKEMERAKKRSHSKNQGCSKFQHLLCRNS